MKGNLIVLDGPDGSGKGTQAKLLVERLKTDGYDVQTADFPQYGKWSAQFVEHYLRGEFGSAQEVGASRASTFYALDRYAASFEIRDWLDQGKIVVSNRYVSANKGHQLGKIADREEMKSFLDWVNDFEYGVMGIPIPDLTLFLHMKAEIGQQLVDLKESREYIKGKKRDIHEADLGHLKNAERAYLFCLDNDKAENWKRITCYEKDQPRPIEDIHKEVYQLVKQFIEDKR